MPKRTRSGPKAKISPKVITKICEARKSGASMEIAANSARIGRRTLYEWLERGKKEPDGLYRQLLDEMELASGQGAAHLLDVIQSHAEGCKPGCQIAHEHRSGVWTAAAWKLERMFPEAYGKKRVEMTGPNNGPLQFAIKWDDGGGSEEVNDRSENGYPQDTL